MRRERESSRYRESDREDSVHRSAGRFIDVPGKFILENRTGYDTHDLARFFARGYDATRLRGKIKIVVTAAPRRSRGCADVGGRRMSISLASPSNFSLRRLARLFEHEAAHLGGLDHKQMQYSVLMSLGRVPDWAHGLRLRHWHKAPDQLEAIAHSRRNS